MELIELEKQLEALQEQIKSMKNADESCDKLTEAEDEEIEATEEKAETVETPDAEESETEEEKIVEVTPEMHDEAIDDNAVLVDNISKELLRSLMSILDDINMLGDNLEDDKYIAVFDEVKEHINIAIGSVQAVVADGSEDAQVQDEAREEAENMIDGEAAESEESENKGDVEVIEPVDEEEIEEVSEEDVEESFENSHDKKLNEDLQITIGFHDYEPWSGAKDTYNYIMEQYGWDESAVESVLEEIFPDGCTDTELNDFFWFDDDIYEIFGVKDPYAEDENDDDEDEEEEFDEDVDESCNPDDIDESTHKCHRR